LVEPSKPVDPPNLSDSTRAKAIALLTGSNLDAEEVEHQFYDYIQVKGTPKYLDRAFLGFVRKKLKAQS
jgi:hypothetical protein